MRRLSLLLFTACALSLTSAAAAPKKKPAPVEVTVDVVEELYQNLEYEQANAAALEVLKKKGLGYEELRRTYRVLAITYAVLDLEEEAREVFIKLLAVDPSYEGESSLGPRVQEPFLEARGYFRSSGRTPGLTVEPQVRREGGVIRVSAKGPPKFVTRLQVGYRWGPRGNMNIEGVLGATASFEVKKAPVGVTRFDYFVFAYDENENTVMAKGSREVPLTLFADERGSDEGAGGAAKANTGGGSVFGKPWFWIAAGALVLGGAAGGYYFFGPANVSAPSSAMVQPTLRCGTGSCQ